MKTFIQTIVLFYTLNLAGQGAHYSLIHNMNQYLNPALVGNGIEENKLSSNFRRQWSALGFSYNSSNVKFEKKMGSLSIGGLFQNNNAGSNTIKDNLFEFSLGYNSPLSSYSRLSFGLGLGLFEQSFNPTNLTFENQYQLEIGYNAGLSSRENFETTKMITPELSAGVNLELFNDDVISVLLGVGVKSLLANKNRFTSLEAIENHNKVNINLQAKWNVSSTYQVQAFVLKSNKVRADELMMLFRNKFLVSKDVEVFFGGGIRNKDAVICDIGFKKGNINVALAHDISISRLYNTSSTEISIALTFGKVKRKRIIKKTESEEKLMIVKDTIIDNDFDNDGIVNGLDLCPYEFGMKKHKGCPFNDLDKDGITDDKDLCPTLFGSGTLSGCPDSDKDGISDHIDKCPQNPGSVLNEGCPEVRYIERDEVREEKNNKIKELDTLVIYFEENSFQVDANYKLEIIQFIKNISSADLLIINGHTNDNGSGYYNKNLGDLRSKSVITFLKKLGINNNIIIPVSYGENKPYVSNQSIVGKTLNRRVELVRLKK
jgi:type IX secretion system PorP/SprF family membrane protein